MINSQVRFVLVTLPSIPKREAVLTFQSLASCSWWQVTTKPMGRNKRKTKSVSLSLLTFQESILSGLSVAVDQVAQVKVTLKTRKRYKEIVTCHSTGT